MESTGTRVPTEVLGRGLRWGLALGGLTVVGLLVAIIAVHEQAIDTPQQELAHLLQFQNEIYQAHVQLEELLAGDLTNNPAAILSHAERSTSHLEKLGESLGPTEEFMSLETHLTRVLEVIVLRLDLKSPPGAPLDQEMDQNFAMLLELSQTISSSLHYEIESNRSYLRVARNTVLGSTAILFFALLLSFRRYTWRVQRDNDRLMDLVKERKSAEARWRFEALRTAAIFEHCTDGFITLGAEGEILTANTAFRELLQLEEGDMANLRLDDIEALESPEEIRNRMESIRKTGKARFDTQMRLRDGSIVAVEINTHIFSWQGTALHFTFVRDLSERREFEAREKKLAMRNRETQKLESLGVLSGNVAHDLNNIMAVVMGNADLAKMELKRSGRCESAISSIETILAAARRASDLAGQMQTYSGFQATPTDAVNWNEVISEVSSLLEVSVSKKIELQTKLVQDIPNVNGDASALGQVVMNLVTNASEALGDTVGVIGLETSLKTLGEHDLLQLRGPLDAQPGSYVVLTVQDSGPGIELPVLERIFEPFFSTKGPGRGLGMSSLFGIVKSHGGALDVHTTLGIGTTFQVFLPVASARESLEPQDKIELPPDCVPEPLTVLLVDDEPALLKLNERGLGINGYKVLTASNGVQALEILERDAGEIDVIVLDMQMPVMGGLEVLRNMEFKGIDIPVIVTSGNIDQVRDAEEIPGPVTKILDKPYRIADLVQAVAIAGRTTA